MKDRALDLELPCRRQSAIVLITVCAHAVKRSFQGWWKNTRASKYQKRYAKADNLSSDPNIWIISSSKNCKAATEMDNPAVKRKQNIDIGLGVQLSKLHVQQEQVSARRCVKRHIAVLGICLKCYTRAVIPATHKKNMYRQSCPRVVIPKFGM